jgi:hypothetical protein
LGSLGLDYEEHYPAEERAEVRILIGFVLLLVAVIHVQSERHRCWQMPLASDYWVRCITQSTWDLDVIGLNTDHLR